VKIPCGRNTGRRLVLCLVVLAAIVLGLSAMARAAERKNVLILHSYHQGFKWTDDITGGIVSTLDSGRVDVRIFIEYMGTKWANDARYMEELSHLLKIKYAKTRFDLIICSDTDAFVFLRDRRDQLFGTVPVVFCGVNYFTAEDLKGRSLFTGTSETADIRETFDLALKLHPATRNIFVINDHGTPGARVRQEIDSLLPLYAGKVRFIFEGSNDLDAIVRDVASLPSDTLIFYTFFYGDPASRYYDNAESITRISQAARVPVYGAWDFNLGYGLVGGKLTSGHDQGVIAGTMGLRILKGERVDAVPIAYRNPSRYLFDYRQLGRFHIERSRLPSESVLINEPEPFHKVGKGTVRAAVSGLVGLGMLVLILVYVIRQRRMVEESLRQARDNLESKVGERTRDLTLLNEKLSDLNRQLAAVNAELQEDMGKRLRTEEELRRSQSILGRIFDANPDHLVVIDREMRIIHSNWLGGFEYVPPEIRERKPCCWEAYNPGQGEPCDACPAIEVFRTGKAVFREMFNTRIGYLEIRAVPILDDTGEVFLVAEHIRDITERKKMEEEILKAQKLESLGVLAGGIAHDFNNLLTGIMGNISLSKMYSDPSGKAFARLDEAEKACHRATGLTRQLLTFAKGGEPVKKAASIGQILGESAGFVLRGSNVRCESCLKDDVWAVEIDEGQMSQVFSNLFINADQAMPEGGIITVHADNVTVGASDSLPLREGRYVRISIRDQGSGISEEDLPKIFDPYFTTKEKGSGLGLSTVYSIIHNHGGHVEVETTVGVGTVFHLYLPASDAEPAPPAVAGKEGATVRNAGRILVMDDEELVREIAREILAHLGYDADLCSDGGEALDMYRQALAAGCPYSAVIMDLTVPGGMGGKEAMKALLDMDPEVKGIVSSGYSNDPVLARFREYGFRALAMKPYSVDELSAALDSVLT
jgi:signal transduction histidine kinase/CheY-like chemotaxis protein/ABC-type uncharacterized transport system substrate-binding protein